MSLRNEFKMYLYSIINAYLSVTHIKPNKITQARLHFGFALRQNMFTQDIEQPHEDLNKEVTH